MTKSKKFPAFQFYPGDWRKDPAVSCLSLEQRGAYLELLLLMHESEERGVLVLNGSPLPSVAVGRALGVSAQKAGRLVQALVGYGTLRTREADGALYSRRMMRDEHLRAVRAAAGRLGGNPVLRREFAPGGSLIRMGKKVKKDGVWRQRVRCTWDANGKLSEEILEEKKI